MMEGKLGLLYSFPYMMMMVMEPINNGYGCVMWKSKAVINNEL